MVSLDRIRSLIEVARHGVITQAARALGLTQPALTRRIQQLEEEFGAELLARGRRGVVLTDLGHLVAGQGRQLLERYAQLKEDVGAHLRLEAGAVRVGGGATAVSFLLPEVIRGFRRRHPDVLFQLKEAGSREIEARVVAEELEIGIVTLPVQAAALEATPLFKDRIVLVAARSHPLAGRPRVVAAALAGAPLVGFEGGSAIRRLIDRALEQGGVRMRVVMELRSVQSILRMVGLDLGLAFVSHLGVDENDPRLRVVPVSSLRIQRTLAVITRRGRPLSVAAEAFLQHLRQPDHG
ncbi:MAG: LysR family transcriptional regulator [Planctomycetota bacterium]|jgi:LysR family transcriptional activator of glutamate synthase operon